MVRDTKHSPTPREAALALERRAKKLLDRYLAAEETNGNPAELEDLLQRAPEDSCLYERGFLAHRRGDSDQAVEYLSRAAAETFRSPGLDVTCDVLWPWIQPFFAEGPPQLWPRLAAALGQGRPDSAAIHFLTGLAENAAGRTTPAAECFQRCLDRDEHFWLAAWELGNIRFDQQQWPEALACYERALREADDCLSELYCDSASCHRVLQNREAAVTRYLQALEADERNWAAAHGLGDLYMQEGNWKRAIGYYERAIVHAADESKLGIWYSIGACHLHLEEHEAAVAAFATCLKRDPGFHRARNSLGFALMRAGKLEQAVQVLRGLPRLGSLSGLASRPKLP